MLRFSRILLEALDSPLREWAGLPVTGYTVSRYSIVVLANYWCGIAYAASRAKPSIVLPETISTRYLARLADRGALERSLAIAAVNAATSAWLYFTPGPRGILFEPCLVDVAGVQQGDVVVIAGFMEPLARRARERGARVIVVENDPDLRKKAQVLGYSIGDPDRVFREADKVFMSGSGLVEDVEESIRELREASGAVKAVVGPTSSFHPLVGKRIGVDIVAGSLVPLGACDLVWRMVSQGHGFHSLSRRIRLVKWAARVHEAF